MVTQKTPTSPLFFLLSFSLLLSLQLKAQEISEYDGEIKSIDSELEKQRPKEEVRSRARPEVNVKIPTVNYSDVKSSVDYNDIAVVQKNFMPKSQRFQVAGGLTLAPNDVFYRTMGFNLRGGYHFTETWGFEVNYIGLSSSKSAEATDLEEKQRVSLQNVVTPKSFLGVNAYFNSMYGKAAFSERAIIPFEIYQIFGFGQVTTASSSGNSGFYFGIGDMFSRSRNGAWKIELSVWIYNSKTSKGDSLNTNTLFLTFGYGHFFPEAGRR